MTFTDEKKLRCLTTKEPQTIIAMTLFKRYVITNKHVNISSKNLVTTSGAENLLINL